MNWNHLEIHHDYKIDFQKWHFQDKDVETNCKKCDKKFGGLVTKKHCSFCRSTICKICSDKNVIIYVPDDDDIYAKEAIEISVIKVIGVRSIFISFSCVASPLITATLIWNAFHVVV